jgi:hypothetical protein
VPDTVGELLQRVGVDPHEVVAEELPHNRWLSPGVWRVRTRGGQDGVLKYTTSDRGQGETPSDAHWTARDHDPRRWTYWCREPLAYQHDLAGAYAGSGIVAPACLGVHVDDSEAVLLLEWVGQQRQYRYGGAGEIDPAFKFRERSRALLFNAQWARQAVELAGRLGL